MTAYGMGFCQGGHGSAKSSAYASILLGEIELDDGVLHPSSQFISLRKKIACEERILHPTVDDDCFGHILA